MKRPKVDTSPVANQYAAPHERIVEYHYASPAGLRGGLISFTGDTDTGDLRVHLYRTDPGVTITTGSPAPAVQDAAALLARVLPMLESLGDHIGNGPTDPDRPGSLGARCDLILDIKNWMTADHHAAGR